MTAMDDLAERHLAACRRFGEPVAAGEGKWDRPSPCDAWDARGVLEHVIGFHDVLILRPLGLKPGRPRDDPRARWQSTYDSLTAALESGTASQLDAYRLMPNLSCDVVVHAWDLARAVGPTIGWIPAGAKCSTSACRRTPRPWPRPECSRRRLR
jgi:uncharacterized protein (TIGR03083 family)